jgi:hypothetical protein
MVDVCGHVVTPAPLDGAQVMARLHGDLGRYSWIDGDVS